MFYADRTWLYSVAESRIVAEEVSA